MQYGIPMPGQFVSQASEEVRLAFIRRVYLLFFASVLTTIATGIVAAMPSIAPAVYALQPLFLIGTFACLIGMWFGRRASGFNVVLLYLFAALEGGLLGPYVSLVNRILPGVPAQAAWLAGGVFGGLSLYVFQSRKDFSYLGGMLWASLLALCIAGFVMFFVGSTVLHTLYCVIGILIFSGYVLYDTSQIISHLEPGDEVVGAIELYLDLINLFLLIMRLLGIMNLNSRSDD